jgi:hypothetical protein
MNDTLDLPLVAPALVFGTLLWWNGVKTWRGEQTARFIRYERAHGPTLSGYASRRQYRSRGGSTYVGVASGPPFVLLALVEIVRAGLSEEPGWWPVVAASGAAIVVLVACGLFTVTYQLVGVPDRLRPPCQRGWELVHRRPELVRPEAFREHPRYRRPGRGPD